MKNILLLISISVFCIGCTPNAKNEKNIQDTARVSVAIDTTLAVDSAQIVEGIEEYANYYILIADTNTSYYMLRNKMLALSKHTQIAIDTMGRYYNATKNLIALPDTSSDEIYAGDYFPRRFPSNTLSLEYLALYADATTPKTIALIAGIYANQEEASKDLSKIKSKANTAFIVKAKMFIGCMH